VRVGPPNPERIGNALFYNVLFDIDNTDHQLLSDMTVQVELDVARADQVPTLPVLALDKRGNDGRYTVQVLDATGKINPRQVRIGIRDDAHAQVLEGVKPGERVLLTLPAATPSTTVH
jgi:macrolide-specific efflux system membrane fusion protein